MNCYAHRHEVTGNPMPGHLSYLLLTHANGATNGFLAGLAEFTTTEYVNTHSHSDCQEGFAVIEGKGYAMVDDQEIALEKDTFFLVRPNQKHAIRRDASVPMLKVCFFHAAV